MLGQLGVDELLAAIGERTPAPASGAATALTAALAAALGELTARYAGEEDDAERAHMLANALVELGDLTRWPTSRSWRIGTQRPAPRSSASGGDRPARR